MRKSFFIIFLAILMETLCLFSAGYLAFTFASDPKPEVKTFEKKIYQEIKQALPSAKPLLLKTKFYATPRSQPTISPSPIPSPIIETPDPKSEVVSPVSPTFQVSVSINNYSSFDISISDGANHCDVLTKALGEGKISSLNMRFDQNYGSYAVFQINGIGKENSVWWVYEVNGQKLSQGCSFVKAKSGDKVEWKYLGL